MAWPSISAVGIVGIPIRAPALGFDVDLIRPDAPDDGRSPEGVDAIADGKTPQHRRRWGGERNWGGRWLSREDSFFDEPFDGKRLGDCEDGGGLLFSYPVVLVVFGLLLPVIDIVGPHFVVTDQFFGMYFVQKSQMFRVSSNVEINCWTVAQEWRWTVAP
ncbi:MAG: hypothetical protein ACYDB4_19365 [Candidatus Dormibacteraceae bacterium]